MKITRENYEPFFLDYLEGNLEPRFVDEFMEFIMLNPGLKAELEMYEPVTLTGDFSEFPNPEKLYKSTFDKPVEFENAAIAFMEHDLTADEKTAFIRFIEKNPAQKDEAEIFLKTRLQPDLQIKFSNKKQLYRQSNLQQLFWWTARIAAVLLVALAFWTIWQNDNTPGLIRNQTTDNLTIIKKVPENSTEIERIVVEANALPEKISETKNKHLKTIYKTQIANPEIIQVKEAEKEILRTKIALLTELPVKKVFVLQSNAPVDLARMTTSFVVNENIQWAEAEPLTDILIKKAGLGSLSVKKIARAGLEWASDLTKNKVSYKTDTSGEIIALSLDTRLLGLSIPVNRK